MDEEIAFTIIMSVKSKSKELSKRAQLSKEIEKIKEARMEFFAKLYCRKNFGHSMINHIPNGHIDSFIEYIEPFVAAGLAVQRERV